MLFDLSFELFPCFCDVGHNWLPQIVRTFFHLLISVSVPSDTSLLSCSSALYFTEVSAWCTKSIESRALEHFEVYSLVSVGDGHPLELC